MRFETTCLRLIAVDVCWECYCGCGEGNYETLRLEPEKKQIDVSKLLREFFNRHYLAQHMSLVILSNGMLFCISLYQSLFLSCVVYRKFETTRLVLKGQNPLHYFPHSKSVTSPLCLLCRVVSQIPLQRLAANLLRSCCWRTNKSVTSR